MEIESLCNTLSSVTMTDRINLKLLNDINIIIREIVSMGSLEVDIYEVCVSCGNDIIWDQDYTIEYEDIKWLSNSGKIYFFETLNSFIPINQTNYYSALKLYTQIYELFSKAV